MDRDVQEVINEYTGKRIDKVEEGLKDVENRLNTRIDGLEDRMDTMEEKIVVMDSKIDSQSIMLQTLIDGQAESKKRRSDIISSVGKKVIETIVIAILGFIGTAVMMMLKGN